MAQGEAEEVMANGLEDILAMGYAGGDNSLAAVAPPPRKFVINGQEYSTTPSAFPGSYADPSYRPPPASEMMPRLGSMALDFVPIVGDIKSAQEAITGKDLLTGEKYNWLERVLAGAGALPFIPNVAGQIKAFHGSPHKFDKFKMEKVGTGEGAQAFGHGLYFTSEKEIARQYARAIKDEAAISEINKKLSTAAKEIDLAKTSQERNAIRLGRYNKLLAERDAILESKGETYSVTLHKGKEPGEYDYLKWNEPLSKEQIKKIWDQAEKETGVAHYKFGDWATTGKPTAESLYKDMTRAYGEAKGYGPSPKAMREASAFLLRAGIDGIEYPAGSLSGGTKKGAKNYVVFDENAITIEK